MYVCMHVCMYDNYNGSTSEPIAHLGHCGGSRVQNHPGTTRQLILIYFDMGAKNKQWLMWVFPVIS